jgi:D-serine deaminase-like pyridoxal phosphate-dependent protein
VGASVPLSSRLISPYDLHEGASVLFLSDEHATIILPPESTIRVGDRIELWPSHIDPTINLHDAIFAVDGDEVVEVWPVAARGYSEHRASISLD